MRFRDHYTLEKRSFKLNKAHNTMLMERLLNMNPNEITYMGGFILKEKDWDYSFDFDEDSNFKPPLYLDIKLGPGFDILWPFIEEHIYPLAVKLFDRFSHDYLSTILELDESDFLSRKQPFLIFGLEKTRNELYRFVLLNSRIAEINNTHPIVQEVLEKLDELKVFFSRHEYGYLMLKKEHRKIYEPVKMEINFSKGWIFEDFTFENPNVELNEDVFNQVMTIITSKLNFYAQNMLELDYSEERFSVYLRTNGYDFDNLSFYIDEEE